MPERGGSRLYLGPTALTGKSVSGADSKFAQGQGYTVSINFTNAGSSQWDALGQKYFHQAVAIELDGVVQSAPVIQPDAQSVQVVWRYRVHQRRPVGFFAERSL